MTGGGSGGHITPILAVAHEIKQQYPDAHIFYVGQRGDALLDVPQADPNFEAVYTVSAGKLRRYSGEGWKQLLDVKTQARNLRDGTRVLRGLWQSFWLIRRLKPDVIFTRGGFVSVPVAIGGKLNHIPYITHDSDSVPSLANRLIARWAHMHAVALPPDVYPYPLSKTVMVGIPVSAQYVPVTQALRETYRQELGLNAFKHVIFITGGGNGARRLNEEVVMNSRYLLARYPELCLVHVTGRALEDETNVAYDQAELGGARTRVKVQGFVHDLYRYSGAADVVVARGGATNLAEFAIQGTACLLVPSKQLGWNVKNSAVLAKRQAIVELSEDQADQPERLGRALSELLDNDTARLRLGMKISELGRPDAAQRLAHMIVDIAGGKRAVRQ